MNYTDEMKDLTPAELEALSQQNQSSAMELGNFTETGIRYQNAVLGGSDLSPPSPPPGLSVTLASVSSLYLEWDPAEDNVAVYGYKIYR